MRVTSSESLPFVSSLTGTPGLCTNILLGSRPGGRNVYDDGEGSSDDGGRVYQFRKVTVSRVGRVGMSRGVCENLLAHGEEVTRP